MDFNMTSPDRVQEPARHDVEKISRTPRDNSNIVATTVYPVNLRRTPAENWTTMRGRFPGSRVIAFVRLPKILLRISVTYLDDHSPVTVAGAATASNRVP
jgi:hypothetical protein